MPEPITLEIDKAGERITGFGGCNQFFGAISITKATARISAIGATKRACLDDGVGKLEMEFFQALEGSHTWKTENDRLILRRNDSSKLVFIQN
jgi:heat shock protein HslJ